jgi:hypothetical protein
MISLLRREIWQEPRSGGSIGSLEGASRALPGERGMGWILACGAGSFGVRGQAKRDPALDRCGGDRRWGDGPRSPNPICYLLSPIPHPDPKRRRRCRSAALCPAPYTHFQDGRRAWRIPKGFRLKAQGCEARATLGKRCGGCQPQRGCACLRPAFRPQPRLGCRFPPDRFPGLLVPRNPGLEDTIPLGLEIRVRSRAERSDDGALDRLDTVVRTLNSVATRESKAAWRYASRRTPKRRRKPK